MLLQYQTSLTKFLGGVGINLIGLGFNFVHI
jgi:hypothetical protein